MATQKVTAKQAHPQSKSSARHSKSVSSTSERHILQEMAAYSRQLAKDPKAAREFLTSAGILTAKGNLRKIYGG